MIKVVRKKNMRKHFIFKILSLTFFHVHLMTSSSSFFTIHLLRISFYCIFSSFISWLSSSLLFIFFPVYLLFFLNFHLWVSFPVFLSNFSNLFPSSWIVMQTESRITRFTSDSAIHRFTLQFRLQNDSSHNMYHWRRILIQIVRFYLHYNKDI